MFAAAALASGQETQPGATTPAVTPPPAASGVTGDRDTTANEPSPTPLAGALKSQPADAGTTGVIRYDPPFFADFRPDSAAEMVLRLPGFSLDSGASVRGFAGAAGNVLIDGQRPTTKQDSVENQLRRIPSSQVDRKS